MKSRLRLFRLCVGLGLSLGIGTAQAGTLVEFPNVADRPDPAHLLGYLTRPDGEGSFPAVVVLPGCMGISGHSTTIADRLKQWGYVALTVDSLGPRGLSPVCGTLFLGQITDAFAALQYLSRQSFVDPERVAVLGNSLGGSSALFAVDRIPMTQAFEPKFRAAIAYYPGCGIPAAVMIAPTLILIGEADDWTRAETCRQLAELTQRDGAAVELTVYPGAYHGFDAPMLQPGIRYLGHWLEYNVPAARDAEAKTRAFLATHLGGAPPNEPRAP
jgi:dienelactone hydrolase